MQTATADLRLACTRVGRGAFAPSEHTMAVGPAMQATWPPSPTNGPSASVQISISLRFLLAISRAGTNPTRLPASDGDGLFICAPEGGPKAVAGRIMAWCRPNHPCRSFGSSWRRPERW